MEDLFSTIVVGLQTNIVADGGVVMIDDEWRGIWFSFYSFRLKKLWFQTEISLLFLTSNGKISKSNLALGWIRIFCCFQ